MIKHTQTICLSVFYYFVVLALKGLATKDLQTGKQRTLRSDNSYFKNGQKHNALWLRGAVVQWLIQTHNFKRTKTNSLSSVNHSIKTIHHHHHYHHHHHHHHHHHLMFFILNYLQQKLITFLKDITKTSISVKFGTF